MSTVMSDGRHSDERSDEGTVMSAVMSSAVMSAKEIKTVKRRQIAH
jgi:hypothetical protein